MMQKTPTLTDLPARIDQPAVNGLAADVDSRERRATIWVSRATSFIGAVCLLLALLEWATRPGHLRTVLALLVVAMFAAILHSYTFEDGS
jgi:hypothetical protein